MLIKSLSSKENALIAAAKELNKALESNKNFPVLLLLSGGSALSLLDEIDTQNISQNITIAPLDERYHLDEKVNNFAQIESTRFYIDARKAGGQFIDTKVGNNETKEELARRFDNSLKEWFDANPNGKVIATIGIGPDGHTSGIMPFPEDPEKFHELFEGERLVTAYDASGKNEYSERVTTTLTLMKKIDEAIVYVIGENKHDALISLSQNKSLFEVPAGILLEMKSVCIFTDQNI